MWLILAAAFCFVGVVLRVRGLGQSLAGDEAKWAFHLFERTYFVPPHTLRPVGFMLVSDLLTSVYRGEETLRLLSLVGGSAALPFGYLVVAAVTRSSALGALATSMLALHPVAIDLSREFKPYALELGLHALALLVVVRFLRQPSRRRLLTCLGTLIGCQLFAHSTAFLLPGALSAVGLMCLRTQPRWLFAASGAVVVLLVGLAVQASTLWSFELTREEHWGKRYDVFHLPEVEPSKARWAVDKYDHLVRWPLATRSGPWKGPDTALADAFGLLHLIGVVALLGSALARRRRFAGALLLLTPIAVVVTVNMLGFWPMGPFRTNAFLLLYLTLVPLAGLAWVARILAASRWPALAPVPLAIGVLFATPNFPTSAEAHRLKWNYSAAQPLLEHLYEQARPAECGRPDIVLARFNVWQPMRYHAWVHSDGEDGRYREVFAFHRPRTGAEPRFRGRKQPCPSMIVRRVGTKDDLRDHLEAISGKAARVFVSPRTTRREKRAIALASGPASGWRVVGSTEVGGARLLTLRARAPARSIVRPPASSTGRTGVDVPVPR